MKPKFNAVDWILLSVASPFWILILLISATSIHLRPGGILIGFIVLSGTTAAVHHLLKSYRHAFAISCLISGVCQVLAILIAVIWSSLQ